MPARKPCYILSAVLFVNLVEFHNYQLRIGTIKFKVSVHCYA